MKIPTTQSFVRFAALLSGTAVISIAQAQPTISSLYPNGAYQFQASPTLSFVATSSGGVTNVSVQLTATTLQGSSSFKTLTPGNGLSVSGAATNETISANLRSNFLYTAVIQVFDAGGTTSSNITFDTIIPAYTYEAEDWDYTNGLFIDNPQTNAYHSLGSTAATDFQHSSTSGGGAYRPLGLSTEGAGDKPRVQYIGTGQSDYDVGFNNGGDWANYTRHYPAGIYNIYMRGSDGGGQAGDSASISVVSGTGILSASGTVSVPNVGGWQSYSWIPFKDSGGNLVTVTFDGTATTLRITTDGGSYNANFYMLLPTNAVTTGAASDAVITNVYPEGAFQFEYTNTLSFTVNSTLGVTPGNVVVQLNATNLDGTGSSQTLGNGSGLTITGPATNLTVTGPLTSNKIYSVSLQVTDANGNGAVSNLTFDTIIPGYTFEAEDWDYSGGLFFDNPQTNAYAGLDGGTAGVDQNCPNNVHSFSYRGGALLGFGLNNEPASDTPRMTHGGLQDYDVGFTAGGDWGNYTRHYPSGIYNIYVRASRGDGGNVTDAGSFALVTSGYQTTSQTTSQIGTYNVSSTGNWQKYGWNPVKDSGGNLARFTADGTLKTLRVTIDGGGHNQNFFMLMPADLSMNPPPFANGFLPNGASVFEPSNTLSFVANSSVGIATNNIVVNLDGAVAQGLSFSGTPNTWTVSCPVATNLYHTVMVTLTDPAGTTHYTNSFGTFSENNYQWEAEDYDYATNGISGQFFDNPQIGLYTNLPGNTGIDFVEADLNAFGRGYVYRPANDFGFPDTASGDGARIQFTTAGATDYSIGSFGPGSWANYTRHYPAGTYNVIGRFAEGASPSEATLGVLTSGYATSNQTVTVQGTFFVPVKGWSSWEWAPLVDSQGNPVKLTLNGSQTTLQLGGSPVGSQPEVNVNFLMLVATTAPPNPITLTATRSGANVVISFLTQTGFNYQVQYKANLTDATWLALGSALPGNGATQSVSDPVGGTSRFYRVKIQ